jgi:hypothetical protein
MEAVDEAKALILESVNAWKPLKHPSRLLQTCPHSSTAGQQSGVLCKPPLPSTFETPHDHMRGPTFGTPCRWPHIWDTTVRVGQRTGVAKEDKLIVCET